MPEEKNTKKIDKKELPLEDKAFIAFYERFTGEKGIELTADGQIAKFIRRGTQYRGFMDGITKSPSREKAFTGFQRHIYKNAYNGGQKNVA